MQKIYIIGIVGAGKTTMARQLSNRTGIPLYGVDEIVHIRTSNGSIKLSEAEQKIAFKKINESPNWIIEGTYRKSCEELLEYATQIIFLDPPLALRKWRIVKRYVKQQLGIEKCNYKSDLNMLKSMYKWTRDFEKNRPTFEAMLGAYQEKLLVVKSARELDAVFEGPLGDFK